MSAPASLVTAADHPTREVAAGKMTLQFNSVAEALREAIRLTTSGAHEELFLWRPCDVNAPGARIVRGDVRGLPKPEPLS